MHELSICRALIQAASEAMQAHPGRRLSLLRVRVGALSGCEPALLAHLFPHARAGTLAAGAALEVALEPARVHCPACDTEAEVAANRLCCPHCHSPAVRLVAGDAVMLMSLQLTEEEEAPCAKNADAR